MGIVRVWTLQLIASLNLHSFCPSLTPILFLLPQDTSSRSFFDPTSQHRDWCPWVNLTVGKETKENGGTEVDASTPADPGWKVLLNVLLAHKQSNQPAETDSTVRQAPVRSCAALAVHGTRSRAHPIISTLLTLSLLDHVRQSGPILDAGMELAQCFCSSAQVLPSHSD